MNKGAIACALSIRYLFRGVEERTLEELPAPTVCRLWTFTFLEEEVRRNVDLAVGCWRAFMKDSRLTKLGLRCVRVLECKEGNWHYHAVTPDWWDVDVIREIWEYHRGGRVNVVVIPFEKAGYVGKYLNKRAERLPPGTRRWSCVGFGGCSVSNLRIKKSVRWLVPVSYREELYDAITYHLPDNGGFSVRLRKSGDYAPTVHHMEIKPVAAKEIVASCVAGRLTAVGEYRGTAVRSQKFEDFKTKQMVEKHIVEHSIEFGGMAVSCAEWLPTGADPKAIRPPANKGDIVLVTVSKASKQYGYTVDSIKPLTQLV